MQAMSQPACLLAASVRSGESLLVRARMRCCIARNAAAREPSGSACLEVVAERFADHRGRGLLITLGALRERAPELWVETNRLDAGWACADRRPASAAAGGLLDVV